LAVAYDVDMTNATFRERVRRAMTERGINNADLARMSGVPYHALDKFLKRESAKTSAENAMALSRALGIKIDDVAEYEELRSLFFQMSEQQQRFLLASIRGLLSE
jgi:transcriptional regulator with XRE-family HTH domain